MPSSAKPNIVVILADDHDDTDVLALMPNLRSYVANKGVRFANSFVDFPACTPSRASFLTGLAARNHGIVTHDVATGGYRAYVPYESNSLPVWLQAAGYRTALI